MASPARSVRPFTEEIQRPLHGRICLRLSRYLYLRITRKSAFNDATLNGLDAPSFQVLLGGRFIIPRRRFGSH